MGKSMMPDFGFGLSPSAAVNLDKVDLGKFERLHEMEPHVYKCMACGACAASCPAAELSAMAGGSESAGARVSYGPATGMSLRKVILCLQRGREKEAVAMVRSCMLCGKCAMVCPRGISTRHLILSICRIYEEYSHE